MQCVAHCQSVARDTNQLGFEAQTKCETSARPYFEGVKKDVESLLQKIFAGDGRAPNSIRELKATISAVVASKHMFRVRKVSFAYVLGMFITEFENASLRCIQTVIVKPQHVRGERGS